MDKIEKFLRQLSSQEQEAYLLLMQQLEKDYTKVPGIKKLSGYKNMFRIRIGRYRMIFVVQKNQAEIIRIGRSEAKALAIKCPKGYPFTKRDDRTEGVWKVHFR